MRSSRRGRALYRLELERKTPLCNCIQIYPDSNGVCGGGEWIAFEVWGIVVLVSLGKRRKSVVLARDEIVPVTLCYNSTVHLAGAANAPLADQCEYAGSSLLFASQ